MGASACSSDDQPRQATSSSVTTTTTNPNVYLQERSEGVAQLLDDLTRAQRKADADHPSPELAERTWTVVERSAEKGLTWTLGRLSRH